MTPGDRLRAARLNAGYKSVAKAAAALSMSESSYRAHENGQNAISPAQAEVYARVFRTTAVAVLFGENPPDTLARLIDLLTLKGVISDVEARNLMGLDADD